MKEIRLGVLGTGFMGKTHIYGAKNIPLYYEPDFKITLAAVCSGHIANAEKAKDLYGFDYATDDENKLFADKNIDALCVCTPNADHKRQILKALDAKKHIYCEKPVTAFPSEIGEILKHKNLDKVTTQAVFHNRFFANVIRAKQIIDEGRLGEILSFRGHFESGGLADPLAPAVWRHTKERSGGGVLYDVGSHISDMVYFLLGEFESVQAKTQIPYKTRPDGKGGAFTCELDEAAYIIATLKNGAHGLLEASKLATGATTDMYLRINGSKGGLIIDLMDPNFLYFYDNTLPNVPLGGMKGFTKIECMQNYENVVHPFPPSKHPTGWIRAHVHSLYCFLNAAVNGKQATPSLRDGLYIQKVLDTVYEAAESGKEVKIK